ncbi:DUF5068 domain-containing protein [Macrococcus capreoli]|uniref:DUF5068 domain-containing protein n=1 Tax=Macrococcus capreoli TaxID=2982690 RepID=UPI0021D5F0DC|nr:DUF5068 domain-containing protein [Macrococcus sp. TMW 2.2395]MCU7556230.1 DUF5068 domain-containing protein [Macrococcus sp. TMW 2.2395]
MKKFAMIAISGALFLTGCSNDNTDKLKKEVEQLKQQKDKIEKEYKSLKEKNKSIDESIKEKQDDIDKMKAEKEKAIKEQLKREEEEKKKQAAKEKAQAEQAKKEQQKNENKMKAARTKEIMPNTIEASTNGKLEVVKSIKDANINLKDAGMDTTIHRIQIFKVTQMPKDQVVLFNGDTEGYVLMYEVTTENTTNAPLYYNNVGMLDLGQKKIFSEYASFIPPDFQETGMKKSKVNYNEYAPKESTTSYKSMAISKEDYKAIASGKAKLMIKGGVSASKTMENKTNVNSTGYLIQ